MSVKTVARSIEAMPILAFAAASPLLLRIRLSRLNAVISRPLPEHGPDAERVAWVVRIVDTTVRWYRPLLPSVCLTRGLTLFWFLRGLGQDVALVFGAGQLRGNFGAHCWLELEGEPYLEKVDPREFFVEIYRFEKAPGQQRGKRVPLGPSL